HLLQSVEPSVRRAASATLGWCFRLERSRRNSTISVLGRVMRIRGFGVLALLGAAFLVVGLTTMSSAQAVALARAQLARSRDSGSVGVLSRPAHLRVKQIPITDAVEALQAGAGVPLIFSPTQLGEQR